MDFISGLFSLAWVLLPIGILSGFIASAPVGPVNLWTAHLMLNRGRFLTRWFVLGVILADMIYITTAISTYYFWPEASYLSLNGWEQILGGLFIMAIGLFSLIKNQKKIQRSDFNGGSGWAPIKSFFTGLLICGSNSMLLLLWLFIAGIFRYYGIEIHSVSELLILLGGILLGDLLWFGGFMEMIHRGRTLIRPIHINRLQKIIAISLVLFGLFTACRQF